ncbi:MAG: gfo/Idh/MocA family oxidoreductase [Chloroflexi bacterium CFX4]|jgi:predicted dehydrogenase|nr:gfo/Idh/MocA family oxidoreductase [Chloroflexi bacterium CFX4]MDL1924423.1 Gfo/Idh/MocA family oxidoreductase [Chloroflexi bacterium CFX3]
MTSLQPIRVALIGGGGMMRHHLRVMLHDAANVHVVAVAEPSSEAYAHLAALFKEAGLPPPPPYRDHEQLLAKHANELDAALISTPHAQHFEQARACLSADLDVLLEKPMVVTAEEARALIAARDQSGRLLVVAFQGSLSPNIREAVRMLRAAELGALQGIQAATWQNWDQFTANTWRQQPELSGGGFLFDTGAHMLNTVSDLAGEDFAEVSAWFDQRGRPVDIRGVVMARLRSGALVTLHATGDSITGAHSEIRVWCERGMLITGQWGERLLLQRDGEETATPIHLPQSLGAWQQFVAVRAGKLPNPCPPEVGLRMARLWDAIRESAGRGGTPISLPH